MEKLLKWINWTISRLLVAGDFDASERVTAQTSSIKVLDRIENQNGNT